MPSSAGLRLGASAMPALIASSRGVRRRPRWKFGMHSETTPPCRDGGRVPCDDGHRDARPDETPVCRDFTCVACTAEDTAACTFARPVCFGERVRGLHLRGLRSVCQRRGSHRSASTTPAWSAARRMVECPGEAPVCDRETNACLPCTANGQVATSRTPRADANWRPTIYGRKYQPHPEGHDPTGR